MTLFPIVFLQSSSLQNWKTLIDKASQDHALELMSKLITRFLDLELLS